MMTPQERQRFDALEQLVFAMLRGEKPEFIETLKRRALVGIVRIGVTSSPATITTAVRNAADLGSENVAKVFDGKTAIIDATGTVQYVGTYNS